MLRDQSLRSRLLKSPNQFAAQPLTAVPKVRLSYAASPNIEPDFDTASHVDQKAQQGVIELDAALWFLGIRDNMQCTPDREVAKAALKNRLAFYSYLLGLEADQMAGDLAFANPPAAVQTGMRAKDELRAAKGKLDEIVSSVK